MGAAPHQVPADVDDQAAMLRTFLARKRILVLLDNAATAQQVRPLLPGSPASAVLVTSRNDLAGLVARDGAHRIPLDVLSPSDSIAVLAGALGAERVRAEPAAAAELARLCGGLPLALRIAAERVAGQPRRVSLSELAVENRRLDLLAVGEDEDTAVRTVFSWSYNALSPPVAGIFRLLGLHAGPEFAAAAGAALAGSAIASVRPLLRTLVRVHLLDEIAPDRYRMHELLRLYAAEWAARAETDQERDAAIQRMLLWYLYTADAAAGVIAPYHHQMALTPLPSVCTPSRFSSYQEALGWFETERINLATATRQAAQTGRYTLAWQLPAMLWEFFNLRKHWATWRATSEIGLASARRLGDREGEGHMLGSLAILNWDLGRSAEAATHFRASTEIWRERGDRFAEGRCLIGMGNAYQGLRRYEEALALAVLKAWPGLPAWLATSQTPWKKPHD